MEHADTTTRTRSGFLRRVAGAATFRIQTYEEVEHDTGATGQAAGVVGLVALAAALGGIGGGPGGTFAGLVGAYLGWALWSGTCYVIGVQLFEGTASWGELLRTIGFAQAPGVLLILRIVPGVGGPLHLAIYLWMIATVFVAIRQALDFTTGRALAATLAGFVPYAVARAVLEQLLPTVRPTILP